jgi:hypothetical protein
MPANNVKAGPVRLFDSLVSLNRPRSVAGKSIASPTGYPLNKLKADIPQAGIVVSFIFPATGQFSHVYR